MIIDKDILAKVRRGDSLTPTELKLARKFLTDLHESLLCWGEEYGAFQRRVHELKMRLDDTAYSQQTASHPRPVKFTQIASPIADDIHGREL